MIVNKRKNPEPWCVLATLPIPLSRSPSASWDVLASRHTDLTPDVPRSTGTTSSSTRTPRYRLPPLPSLAPVRRSLTTPQPRARTNEHSSSPSTATSGPRARRTPLRTRARCSARRPRRSRGPRRRPSRASGARWDWTRARARVGLGRRTPSSTESLEERAERETRLGILAREGGRKWMGVRRV